MTVSKADSLARGDDGGGNSDPRPTLPGLARITESNLFNHGSLALIFISALVLGFETDRELYASNQSVFIALFPGYV